MVDRVTHQVFSVDSAVSTFLSLNQGDAMIIPAHVLNPLLRVIEIMERVCIIETVYKEVNGKNTVNYKVMPGVKYPESSGFCPMTWQVTYTNNPYYKWNGTATTYTVNSTTTDATGIQADQTVGKLTINNSEAQSFSTKVKEELAKQGINLGK